MTEGRILRNRAQCANCGDVIESTHERELRVCSCRAVSICGGTVRLDRSFRMRSDFIDLSELEKS